MKAITKASRINIAIQVIQHMNSGMTVVEACRAVGIPRSSFYYIVENNQEAIADLQAIIDTSNREQLRMILLHNTEVLGKVIQDGISDKTKPRDRLAIYIKLPGLVDDLIQRLQKEDEVSGQEVDSFLTGRKLVQVESSFSPC